MSAPVRRHRRRRPSGSAVRRPDRRSRRWSPARTWRQVLGSWRAILFAPIGDGRPDDGVRMRSGSDCAVVRVPLLAFTHANSNAEHEIATALASPPQGIRWLVTTIWWVASFGVIALIVVLALVNRQWTAIRDIGLSVCGGVGPLRDLVGACWARPGAARRRPRSPISTCAFPVARVAATVAVATAALPYLSRMVQRTIETAIGLLALAAVVTGLGGAGGGAGQPGRGLGCHRPGPPRRSARPSGCRRRLEVAGPAGRSRHHG